MLIKKQNNFAKIVLVLFIVALGVISYRFKDNIRELYAYYFVAPCSRPLTYRIDTMDSRFGISADKFKQAAADAAQIWNKAYGKQLFENTPTGSMPISLVYDNRQAAADQLKKLGLNLDNSSASYYKLKAVYIQDQTQYQTLKKQFESLEQQYKTLKQSYDAAVEAANRRGGATQEEYAQLSAKRDQLNTIITELNTQSAALNELVKTINALVTTLNQLGAALNLDVSAYNSVGTNLGEFQEGVFTSNSFSKSITIYEFTDYPSLVRVLAHELGHSLGMEHVDDKKAIMYRLNQSKNAIPTKADLLELERACKQ